MFAGVLREVGDRHVSWGLMRPSKKVLSFDGVRGFLGSLEGCGMVRPLLVGSILLVETFEVAKVVRWRVSI